MHRSPPACRRAVHSLNPPSSLHSGISSHELAAAVVYFSHISQFCPKRHGSNVPGPLEARKRLAKRRMTAVASQCTSGLPPLSSLFDFGALWGTRSKFRGEPAWRYEPPTPPQLRAPLDVPLSTVDRSPAPATSTTPTPQTPLDTIEPQPILADTAVTSIAQNSRQQKQRQEARAITAFDDQGLLLNGPHTCWLRLETTMETAEKLPYKIRQAHIEAALKRFCPVEDAEGAFLFKFLHRMRGTAQQVHDVPSVVHRLFLDPKLPVPDIRTAGALVLLEELKRWEQSATWGGKWYKRWISAILEQRVDDTDPSFTLPVVLYQQVWKAAFDPEDHTISPTLLHQLWDAFESKEVRHILYGVASPESSGSIILAQEDHAIIARAVGCVPTKLRFKIYSVAAQAGIPPSLFHHQLYRRRLRRNLDLPQLIPWVKTLLAQTVLPPPSQISILQDYANVARETRESHYSSIVSFLKTLYTSGIPNAAMAEMFFDLVHQHEGSPAVFAIMNGLKNEKAKLSDTSILHKYFDMAQSVDADDGYTMGFCRVAAALETTSKTRNHKYAFGTLAVVEFSHIIDRAAKTGVLPLAYRDQDVMDLMPERTFLIHQLAHQYSINRSMNSLQLWRHCNWIYSYSMKHKIQMNGFFVDAMVETMLWRPMAEKRHVTTERLVQMQRLVRHVKGDAAAMELEVQFLKRRGRLIGYAQQRYKVRGGEGKVQVNTMKKLGLI